MTKLFLGVDVSLRENKAVFMDEEGRSLKSLSFSNDLIGASKLAETVLFTAHKLSAHKLVAGLESTSHFSWHLGRFLKEEQSLKALEPKVYVLNAKAVKRFRDSYNDLPKNDKLDAWVIADLLRFGRLPKEMDLDERYFALQQLTRSRLRLIDTITREKNRFLSTLFLKFSSLRADNPFSNPFGTTALAVIEEFLSPEEIASMSLEDLVDFLIKKSKNRFENPEEIAKALQKAARSSYRLPKSLADPINASLASSLSVIKTLESQVKALDKAIENHLGTIPQPLTSIKGIGPVFAAGIIAEIGNISRFDNHAALAKYAGLAWNEHQSGEFKASYTPRIRSGNRFLRYYLVEAALRVKVHNPEYSRYYDKKYAEVTKSPHKRAIVLTARKLVRLIFALLRKNQLHIPEKGR